jgi:uncharacterized YigZ family protein
MSEPPSKPARYPVLAGPFRHELVERRSRFLCVLAPVEDEAAAQALLAELREELPDANHHCWACLVGPPGSTARVGCSDAGEPSGTAGRPMLEALVHGPVGDVAAIVVRWFGGVKLGTGGLARAYGGVVAEALAAAPATERIEWAALTARLTYADAEVARRLYAAHEVQLDDERFEADVTHALRVPIEKRDGLVAALTEATAGRAQVDPPGA